MPLLFAVSLCMEQAANSKQLITTSARRIEKGFTDVF